MQVLGQLGQRHGAGTKLGGQFFAALGRAVGNRHLLGMAGGKVGRDQLNHLARANKQDANLRQILKQLAGQAHGSGGHADAVRTDFGAAAHLFGHRKAALEQLVQGAAQRPGIFGRAHGVFELAQNLRLAQHHGVEARGHAKGMAGHATVFQQSRSASAAPRG